MASENKTVPTDVDPLDFIAQIEHNGRREDAEVLLDLMARVTGFEAQMWGPSIIGFGRYHYVYDSGREGDFLMVGFSPRKANMVVYLLPGYDDLDDELSRLGKHKKGASCLYLGRLSNIDPSVLEEMIVKSVASLEASYDTFPR
jgi:hypothetical protein